MNCPPLSTLAPSAAPDLHQALGRYMRAAYADNTWRTYQAQWQGFAGWCSEQRCSPLPAEPQMVAAYLAQRAQAGAAVASLGVALAALRFAHGAAGLAFHLDDPTLALVLKGIRRQHLRAQRQAAPLTGPLLRQILSQPRMTSHDARDGALLALLYLFGLRAAEVVAIDWQQVGRGRGWLGLSPDRAEIVLLGSKASPTRLERVVIPTAVNALGIEAINSWIAAARILPGTPLLRALKCGGSSGTCRLDAGSIAPIIKRAMARHFQHTGLLSDAAKAKAASFSAHSGRIGLYVTATEAGVAPQQLAALARHGSLNMVRRYAAQADLFVCAPHRAPGVGV